MAHRESEGLRGLKGVRRATADVHSLPPIARRIWTTHSYAVYAISWISRSRMPTGPFAFARIKHLEGNLSLRKKRMVFVKDTSPWQGLQRKGEDDCLKVLGSQKR